jgi:hypothetical protein
VTARPRPFRRRFSGAAPEFQDVLFRLYKTRRAHAHWVRKNAALKRYLVQKAFYFFLHARYRILIRLRCLQQIRPMRASPPLQR